MQVKWCYGIFVVSLMLSSMGSGNTFAQAEDNAESLQTVRLQLKWAHQFQFAGYYAAIEQGYYRDAGLNVELIEYSPVITPIDQLIGGRVHFSVADAGALLYRSTGVPLVALAAIFQHSPSILISLEESGIQSLEDIRGRRAMLAGGYMNAELMAMLQTAGIYGDDLQLLPSNTSIDSLINGQTDVYNSYTTNEPFFLTQNNIPFRIFAPSDYGVDFYGDTLITSESVINADPAMVSAFLEATLQGWAYAVANPEETVDLILANYNSQQKSREHLLFEAEESIKLILPNVVPIGYMNEERWQRIAEIFRQQGQLLADVDIPSFVYTYTEEESFSDIFARYRIEIIVSFVLLFVVSMIYHLLSLRAQVFVRTRELNEAKRLAEIEARTDSLTSLPNRRYFLEELARDIAQAERYGIPLTIISLDIDYFKMINDKFGHAAGDAALEFAGTVFRKHIRSSDIAARIGGEEFAVACPNSNLEDAMRLAVRLCQELEQNPVEFNGKSFKVTFSAGLALMENGDDVEALLQKADQALYAAKENGRNTIHHWNQGLST